MLTQNVDGLSRLADLEGLQPETEYQVFLSSLNNHGRSNNSNVITFKTPPGMQRGKDEAGRQLAPVIEAGQIRFHMCMIVRHIMVGSLTLSCLFCGI